jgi:hypothetical protein
MSTERTNIMSIMNSYALETAASDVVHNPIVINITSAEGECEPKTVMTNGVEFVMTHVQNVSVQFSGRSFAKFSNVSGWLFVSTCGKYSDILLNSNPNGYIHADIAKTWMSKNTETVTFGTTVTIK